MRGVLLNTAVLFFVAFAGVYSADVAVFPPAVTNLSIAQGDAICEVLAQQYAKLSSKSVLGPGRSRWALVSDSGNVVRAASTLGVNQYVVVSATALQNRIVLETAVFDSSGGERYRVRASAESLDDMEETCKRVAESLIDRKPPSSWDDEDADEPANLAQVNLSGPRLGLTCVLGTGAFAQALKDHNINRVYSEFGWHFEFKIAPQKTRNAPSFVVELIPLIGGVEYGTVIPSFTMPMGIRLPGGYEFGIGPNLTLAGTHFSSSVVLAAGKTFRFHGVCLPLNAAFAEGSGGYAVSTVFGYAIVKSKKKIRNENAENY